MVSNVSFVCFNYLGLFPLSLCTQNLVLSPFAVTYLQSRKNTKPIFHPLTPRFSKSHTPTLPGRAYPSDIRSPDSITSLLTTCIADFSGRLDIFVANAGIPWTSGCFLDGPLHSYDSVMKTDLDSVYYCARAAGRVWRRQKEEGMDAWGRRLCVRGCEGEEGEGGSWRGGSFVATASMSGQIVNIPQFQTAYNAAKAGVVQMGMFLSHPLRSFALVLCPLGNHRFLLVFPPYLLITYSFILSSSPM